MVTVQEEGILNQAIQVRYAEEAETCCNLSCGGALDHASPREGEVLVDLGSGRGNDVLKAARLVGSSGMAYGVDMTASMLKVAEINRKKLKLENARFLESEIHATPLEDASVDVVISNCTINHAKDKAAVYAEIHRILKSGGRVVVSDVLAEKPLPVEVVNDPDAWAACYGGAIVKEEYFDAIAKSGFDEVDVLEESEPYEKGGVSVISMTLRLVKK